MSGKPNDKMFKTMIEKHGSEEAAREWFRKIGTKGGKNGNTGGFAKQPWETPEEHHARVSRAGMKGGKISRRNK